MTGRTVPRTAVPAVSVAAMRTADRDAAARYSIEPIQLMELAGFQLARFVDQLLGDVRGQTVAVVAGAGNNGGDALVAGRHLHNRGAEVLIWLCGDAPRGLTAQHLRTAQAARIAVHDAGPDLELGGRTSVIIDGIFGTGVRLPLPPGPASVITIINEARAPVIAVDVPSGLDADTGEGADRCVQATATLTLGLPKPALLSSAATGRLFIADIGLPPALFRGHEDAIRRLFERDALVEVV
jgi:ADP-dependent NAD(P)H-hydrate dehydratase / NAD(P)H-hydrate epimerase